MFPHSHTHYADYYEDRFKFKCSQSWFNLMLFTVGANRGLIRGS